MGLMVDVPIKTQCQGVTLRGKQCTREAPAGQKYCWQHKYFRKNDAHWYQHPFVGLTGTVVTVAAFFFAIYAFQYGPSLANQERGLEDHREIVSLLRNELAVKNDQVLFLQNQMEKIQNLVPSERAVELAGQIKPEDGAYALALKAIAERRFEDARQYLEKAQREKEIELAYIYSARGNTEIYAGNYNEALEWHEKALRLAPDNRDIWEPTSYALLYMCRYQEAEPLLQRALAIDEKTLGKDHPNVAIDLNNLADLYKETNRLDEAEHVCQRGLLINENSFGKDHPNVACSLSNLAMLYKATNRLIEAEPLMKQALQIDEVSFGKDHPNVAIRLNNLAQLYQATNRMKEAEPMMKRALQIDEVSFGEDHPKVATDLNNLALYYKETNQLGEAELLIMRAIKILKNSGSEPLPNYATALSNLAEIYQDIDRKKEAELLLKQAIEINEKSLGKDHPTTAIALNNLGALYMDMNRMTEAEPFIKRALVIDEASFDKDHPGIARDLNNLAELYRATNRLMEAEPLMKRGIEILIKFPHTAGHPHPDLQSMVIRYVGLLKEMGKSEKEILEQLKEIKADNIREK